MQLEIITQEPPSGARPTPLLFVHGMWHAAWCWAEHFMPYFVQHGYACHALSLRGHGDSEGRGHGDRAGPPRLRWHTLADYVADVAQVAGQMETPPVLVGHSMGGMIVQKYLESRPAPAGVLLAPAPPQGVLAATWRVFRRHPLAVIKVNLKMSMYPVICTPHLTREAFFSADMPEDKVHTYFGRMQDESYRAYLDMMIFNLPRPKRVTTPMLVLGAADDTIISTGEIEATARAFDAQVEVLPSMAHDMMLETSWQTVAERVLAWLDERGV